MGGSKLCLMIKYDICILPDVLIILPSWFFVAIDTVVLHSATYPPGMMDTVMWYSKMVSLVFSSSTWPSLSRRILPLCIASAFVMLCDTTPPSYRYFC